MFFQALRDKVFALHASNLSLPRLGSDLGRRFAFFFFQRFPTTTSTSRCFLLFSKTRDAIVACVIQHASKIGIFKDLTTKSQAKKLRSRLPAGPTPAKTPSAVAGIKKLRAIYPAHSIKIGNQSAFHEHNECKVFVFVSNLQVGFILFYYVLMRNKSQRVSNVLRSSLLPYLVNLFSCFTFAISGTLRRELTDVRSYVKVF